MESLSAEALLRLQLSTIDRPLMHEAMIPGPSLPSIELPDSVACSPSISAMPTPFEFSKNEFRTWCNQPAQQTAHAMQTTLTHMHAVGGASQHQAHLVGAEVAGVDAIVEAICGFQHAT